MSLYLVFDLLLLDLGLFELMLDLVRGHQLAEQCPVESVEGLEGLPELAVGLDSFWLGEVLAGQVSSSVNGLDSGPSTAHVVLRLWLHRFLEELQDVCGIDEPHDLVEPVW